MNEKDGYWKLKVGLLLISVISLIFVISMMLVPPASAIINNETFTGELKLDGIPVTQSVTQNPSTGAGGGVRINVTVYAIENTTGLNYISSSSMAWGFAVIPADHYDVPVTLSLIDTNFTVGEGRLRLDYLEINDPNSREFATSIQLTSWNVTGLTGDKYLIANYNKLSIGDMNPQYYGTVPSKIPFTSLAYISYARAGGVSAATKYNGKGSGAISNSFSYFFKNSYAVSSNNATQRYTYSIIRNQTPPYTGRSYGYLVRGITNTSIPYDITDISGETTGAPIILNLKDAQFGLQFIKTFFYPTFSVFLSSNVTSLAQPISATVLSSSGEFSQISAIDWQYYVIDEYTDLTRFYENNDNVHDMNYVYRSGVWYGWNELDGDFTNNKGAIFPTPVNLFFNKAGNATIYLTIYTADGNMEIQRYPVSISSGGNIKTIILEAADWQSGMLVSPVNWSVKNLYTSTWTNQTSTSGDGTWTVQYPAGITLYVEANAYGYAKGTLTKQVPQGNDIWILQLYPLSAVSGNITNSTLLVKVMGDNNDGKFQPLNNVAVTLSDTQSQLTATLGGVAGQAQFTVKNDTIYSISAKKDKYVSVTKTVFVTGDVYTATLFMSPLAGSTVIPTTATTRPTATPTVTLSGYQPAYGNFTGFWAPFENMGVAMGAQPSEVGILMMFLLIIGFLILGGWAAGPLGAEVGVVAGMVCSVAFGFLPFAISIAVIAILCLYGALRIWGVTR